LYIQKSITFADFFLEDMNMAKTSKTSSRRIVALILLCSFVMMPVSGVVVHATHGNALSHTWLHLHVLSAVTFIVAGAYHVVFNWRTLKIYILGNPKKD
jgi:uncharacterized membrane protein